jgi:hypothetical protein
MVAVTVAKSSSVALRRLVQMSGQMKESLGLPILDNR